MTADWQVKGALIVLLIGPTILFAQGWGVREARLPWLQGRFAEAERNFALHRIRTLPSFNAVGSEEPLLCWEAEMAIERGRYGEAAALLKEAKSVQAGGSEIYQRRMARFLCKRPVNAALRDGVEAAILEGRCH